MKKIKLIIPNISKNIFKSKIKINLSSPYFNSNTKRENNKIETFVPLPFLNNFKLNRASSAKKIINSENNTFLITTKQNNIINYPESQSRNYFRFLNRIKSVGNLSNINKNKMKLSIFESNDNNLILLKSFLYENNILCKENYDVHNIFSFFNKDLKEFYNKLIENKINNLIENKDFENQQLLNDYILNKNYKDLKIIFSSLQIRFENLNIHEIKFLNLPFFLLPILYYKNMKGFLYLLLNIIEFNKNFDKAFFNFNNLDLIIKHFSSISNEIDLNIDNNNCLNDYFFKDNIIEFLWNNIKYTFKVEIILPKIKVLLKNIKIYIENYIPKELLLYVLFHKNKINWEFYILNYLNEFKEFRNNFSKNLCFKNKIRNIKIDKFKTIFLKKVKILNLIDNKNLNNSFIFFDTNKHLKTSIFILKSFELNIKKFGKDFNLNFPIKILKYLIEINELEDLKTFFPKIIKENSIKETCSINYEIFENFNINIIKKFSKEESSSSKNSELNINYPYLSIITLNGQIKYEIKLNKFIQIFNYKKEIYPQFLISNFEQIAFKKSEKKMKKKFKAKKYIRSYSRKTTRRNLKINLNI
jgi:hypothetical protein